MKIDREDLRADARGQQDQSSQRHGDEEFYLVVKQPTVIKCAAPI